MLARERGDGAAEAGEDVITKGLEVGHDPVSATH